MPVLSELGGRMSPVIDEEELERIRERVKPKKRNWYTAPERLERVQLDRTEHGNEQATPATATITERRRTSVDRAG